MTLTKIRTAGRYVCAALAAASGVTLMLAGCTDAQLARAAAEGQLYCAVATLQGPLVVALADELGVPVKATGKTAAVVAAACAVIAGIPTMPPPAPAAAPVVAAPVAPAARIPPPA